MPTDNLPNKNQTQVEPLKKRSPLGAKFVMLMIFMGITFCVTIVSFYVPRAISWYFDPPATIGISCTPSIKWALERLLSLQLISVGVGAILGLIFGLLLARRFQSVQKN